MTVADLIDELQRMPNQCVPVCLVLVRRNPVGGTYRVEREVDTVSWQGHAVILEHEKP